MRRSILARVKFLSRLFTALNLLPSIATLACVSRPIARHSAIRDVFQAPQLEPWIVRYELSDSEWATIKPFLPNKSRGVRRVNDRRVLNGIFWVLRSDRVPVSGVTTARPS